MQTIVFQATAAQNATQKLKGSRTQERLGLAIGAVKRCGSDRLSLRPEIDAEETDLWKFLCEKPLDIDCVEEHVRSGECDTNIRDKSFGWSPVLMAANAGEPGLLKLLLASKAKSDVACHEGNSALILAARSGHLETVEFLMSKKADLNVRNVQGWSALHWCCINGHEDISTSLLAASADFNLVDNKGRTACMWAARHGYLEILEALLVCGINLGAEDYAGLTAMDHAQEHMQLRTVIAAAEEVNRDLLEAARRADKQEVRSALQRGADVNLHDENGFNALMWSALHGSLDLVTTLTRHGANPKLVTNSGHIDKLGDQHLAVGDSLRSILGANDRMLDKAVRRKWDEVEEELKIGAWINVRDKDKRTALMWAAKHGAAQAISRLVDKGAHLDERDIFGWTATLFAVWSKSCESLAMLYYLSADFSIRSFEGDSALHVAVRADDGVIVQLLLTSKSDVEEQDVEGYSPLMLAAANGLLNAAATLLAWGGNIKQTDHHKRDPFMLAIMNGHKLMALLMLEQPLRVPPPIPGFEHMNGAEKQDKKSKSHEKRGSSGNHESGKSRDKKSNKSGEAVSNHSKSTPKKSDSKVLFSTPASETRRSGAKISSASKAKLKNVNAPRATKGESPTALIQMAAQQRVEVLGSLPKINAKTLLKEVDKDGRSPLHLAVVHKHIDIMQMLITKASDINAVDLHGNTALHEAAKRNQEPMVCKLLDAACDIGIMNKDKKLAIDLAADVSIKGILQRTAVTRALPTDGTENSDARAVTRSSKQRPIFRAKIEGLPTHLASDILEDNVRALIKKLSNSNPVRLEIAVDPITSRPHGYASVEFSDAAEVDLTIRGDGIVMEGKTLHIFKDSIAPKKRLMTS